MPGARDIAALLLDSPEGAVGRRALGDAVVPPDALESSERDFSCITQTYQPSFKRKYQWQ